MLPIVVPPLRTRREDVALLVDHFVARNNVRLGTAIRGVDTEARRILLEYAWPGNVRELENTIERAMVLSESDLLVAGDLPERIREARDPVQVQLASGELSIKKTTRVIEETLIAALFQNEGQPNAAAEVLELSHRALWPSGPRPHLDGLVSAHAPPQTRSWRGLFKNLRSSVCEAKR